MKRFRLAPQAKSDLQEIHAYIARENVAATERLIDRFFDHFQRLANYPELGAIRDDLHRTVKPKEIGPFFGRFA